MLCLCVRSTRTTLRQGRVVRYRCLCMCLHCIALLRISTAIVLSTPASLSLCACVLPLALHGLHSPPPHARCACSAYLGSAASSVGVSGHATFDLAVSRPPWRRDGPGCVSASLDRCCSSVALPLCGYSAAHGVRSGSLRCPPAGFVCKRMSVLCCDMRRFIYDLFLGWLVEGKMYLYHRGVRDQRLVCVEIFGVTL